MSPIVSDSRYPKNMLCDPAPERGWVDSVTNGMVNSASFVETGTPREPAPINSIMAEALSRLQPIQGTARHLIQMSRDASYQLP